jgi:hypothetical protein
MKFFICLLISFSALAQQKGKPSQSLVNINYEIDILKSVTSDVASNKSGPYQVLSISGIGIADLIIRETGQKDLRDLKIRRSGSNISVKLRFDSRSDVGDFFKQIQECRVYAQRWAVNERGIDEYQGGSYRILINVQQSLFDSQIRGILKAKNPSFETAANPRLDKVDCSVQKYGKK